MKRLWLALPTAVLLLVGCGNPLDGTWDTTLPSNGGGISGDLILDLRSDGSAIVTVTQKNDACIPSCTGSWVYSGYEWTSTDTNITITGTPTCKQKVLCACQNPGCDPAPDVTGTCKRTR